MTLHGGFTRQFLLTVGTFACVEGVAIQSHRNNRGTQAPSYPDLPATNSTRLLRAMIAAEPSVAHMCNDVFAREVPAGYALRTFSQSPGAYCELPATNIGAVFPTQTPSGRTLMRVATAKKAGVMMMHVLSRHLWTGCRTCKHWSRYPFRYNPKSSAQSDTPHLTPQSEPPVVIISRNPYTRFLSGFLEKGAKDFGAAAVRLWDQNRTVDSFRRALRTLRSRFKLASGLWNKSILSNPHFWPQASLRYKLGGALGCGAEPSITVLAQEQQAEWFPCLAYVMGIPLSRLESGWKGVSTGVINFEFDCYWAPPGQTCEDYYSQVRRRLKGLSLKGLSLKSFDTNSHDDHSIGANALVNKFYDAESALTVYELFRDDFDMFGYPFWDGKGDFDSK